MSTISALNNVQTKIQDSTSTADESASVGGENFEKALGLAMLGKNAVSSSPAATIASSVLGDKGLVSAASDVTAIQSSFQDIFGSLSTDLAGAFVAGLAGADSATEVATEEAEEATLASSLTDMIIEKNGLTSEEDIAKATELVESIASLLPSNIQLPIANADADALEDVLLSGEETEEDEEEETTTAA